MKIVLIDPPHESFIGYYRFYFPLGLVSVGSVLQADGHEVVIIDADHLPEGRCFSKVKASRLFHSYYEGVKNPKHPIWQKISSELEAIQPDVVGISVLSCKLPAALKTARLVRQVLPYAKIMVGGDHTVYFNKELASEPDIDAVVVGEGEETARELISAWAHCRPLIGIRGIAFRDGNVIVKNQPRPFIDNLDVLPLPDRRLLTDFDTYRPVDMGLMMTSRGCPKQCTFCGIASSFGRKTRFRSIANCMKEIIHTKETFGTEYFSFRDGTFTINKERVIKFCRALIDSKLGVKWECLTRPDCLDDELVGLMMEANCSQIRLGIESGSEKILKYMQKQSTITDYKRAAKLLSRHGMYWSAYIMFGVPEETLDSIWMTINLIEQIQPSFITLSRYTPLPGTQMYQDVKALGMEVDWKSQNNLCFDQSYSRHISSLKFRDLMERIGEYAADYNRRHADGVISTDKRLKGGFEDHSIKPARSGNKDPHNLFLEQLYATSQSSWDSD